MEYIGTPLPMSKPPAVWWTAGAVCFPLLVGRSTSRGNHVTICYRQIRRLVQIFAETNSSRNYNPEILNLCKWALTSNTGWRKIRFDWPSPGETWAPPSRGNSGCNNPFNQFRLNPKKMCFAHTYPWPWCVSLVARSDIINASSGLQMTPLPSLSAAVKLCWIRSVRILRATLGFSQKKKNDRGKVGAVYTKVNSRYASLLDICIYLHYTCDLCRIP